MSLRSSCASVASEVACGSLSAKADTTQGAKWFVVVEGWDAATTGAFSLSVESRAVTCGDAKTDGTEECDDGNTNSNDGCSSSCKLEADEVEPNGTVAQASAYKAGFHGQISPAGDVDWVKLTATKTQPLTISMYDLGDGACAQFLQDSYLELYQSNGTTLIAQDDDGGAGGCAKLVTTSLGPGVYYLKVTAAPGASPATFPYMLDVLGL